MSKGLSIVLELEDQMVFTFDLKYHSVSLVSIVSFTNWRSKRSYIVNIGLRRRNDAQRGLLSDH